MARLVAIAVVWALVTGGCAPPVEDALVDPLESVDDLLEDGGQDVPQRDSEPPPLEAPAPEPPPQDDSANVFTVTEEWLAGSWQIASPTAFGVTCIMIDGGQVVINDDGCDGVAEPLYGNSSIVIHENAVLITWQFVVPNLAVIGRETLDVELVSDGSLIGTQMFVFVDPVTGFQTSLPQTDLTVVTRLD